MSLFSQNKEIGRCGEKFSRAGQKEEESTEEVGDEDEGDGEGGREGGKKREKEEKQRVSSRGYLAIGVIFVMRRCEERKRGETERYASPSQEKRGSGEREGEGEGEASRERGGERWRKFSPPHTRIQSMQGEKREERGS